MGIVSGCGGKVNKDRKAVGNVLRMSKLWEGGTLDNFTFDRFAELVCYGLALVLLNGFLSDMQRGPRGVIVVES